MLVRDVMTSPAVTAHPDLSLKRVAQLLDEHAVTALPVVDDGGRIVGVISEADVVLEAVPHDPRAHINPHHLGRSPHFIRAADVMNHHPVTVRPDTDLAEAHSSVRGPGRFPRADGASHHAASRGAPPS